MRPSFLSSAVIAALIAGPAIAKAPKFSGPDELDRMTANRTAGKPVDCLSLSDIRATRIVDGTAIVYTGGNGTLYVNRPDGAAELRGDMTLVTDTHTDQLCSVDTVRLVESGMPSPLGSIGLGKFVPYPRPARNTVD